MSPEELRQQVIDAIARAYVEEKADTWLVRAADGVMDAVNESPAIRRALAITAAVDAEPGWGRYVGVSALDYALGHQDLLRRLRAVGGEQ